MFDSNTDDAEGKNYQKISDKIDINEPNYVNHLFLDFSDKIYNLVDIEELDQDIRFKNKYGTITALNISKNSISVLKLKGYMFLEKIIANENSISKVELNLSKLTYLNLSMNNLTKLFELNSIPNIQELILSKNSITRISYEDFKPVKSSLKNLDLENNKIDFNTVKEFFEFFDLMGKYMKQLKNLVIRDNFFNSPLNSIYKEYYYVIIDYCPKLTILNNKQVDDQDMDKNIPMIKERMIKSENYNTPIKNLDKKEKPKEKRVGTVSLIYINKEMSKNATLGKLNQITFQHLKEIIDEYIKNGKDDDEDNGKLEDKEQEDFEAFIEYCNVLIDSTPSIEKDLYQIIASLSVIKNGKFAHRGLTYLNQRISPEKIKDIESVLSNYVIQNYLNKNTVDQLQPSIIDGLELFLSDVKLSDSMRPAIQKILEVAEKNKNLNILNCRSSEDNRLKEIYNSAISFLSTASENYKNLLLMVTNMNFINAISLQIVNLLNVDENKLSSDAKGMGILQKLLNIIRNICMIKGIQSNTLSSTNIDKLVGVGLRDKIEQNLNIKLQDLAKSKSDNNMLQDRSLKESIYNKKKIFANQVRSYGALLYRSKDVIKILNSKNSVIKKIINLLVQKDNCDPIVISASCDFTIYLLQNPLLINNEGGNFLAIVKNLYDLRYVLPYIIPEKEEYKNSCYIAEKYGQFTISKGKPVSLGYLTSEAMHSMLISIANLIEFFGTNSKKDSPIKEICSNMQNELNGQGRDSALCSCLKVPNDEVKKAYVECLYSLDYRQFDHDEILLLNKETKSINLTGGIIEQVVAQIYIILMKSYNNFVELGNSDKLEQNKDSFNLAFEILAKNQERIPHYEVEYIQKNLLNSCMFVFLYNMSCHDELKNLFLDGKNIKFVSKILYFEESNILKNNDDKSTYKKILPIEIENTKTGWNLDSLISCFKGDYALNPYTYVSLRILIHIADLLMNMPSLRYTIDDLEEFETIIDKLGIQIEEKEKERIIIERMSFKSIYNRKKNNSEEKKIELKGLDLLEEQKKFLILFPTLLLFIQGKIKQQYISFYEKVWYDKFDPELDNINYSVNDEYLDENNDEKEHDKIFNENSNLYEDFQVLLRKEEYYPSQGTKDKITEYDYIMGDLLTYNKYGEENLLRMDENPHNPYLRGLFIAAFLRTIYALLEFNADISVKEEMILLLYKPNVIKDITKLADCTKMIENNVASKYLVIMKHVLLNSKVYFNYAKNSNMKPSDIENEYLNKLGIISYMIKKMVLVFKKEIKIEVDDHKIFLSEVSKCLSIICSELQFISFKKYSTRDKIVEIFIDYEIINLFIKIIKDYMNKESEMNDTEKGPINNNELNDMICTISYIIAEYMSKCEKYSYSILESITRSYIFDKVKFRRTYLKEIIEMSRLSTLKMNISRELNAKVSYVTRVYVTDYSTKISSHRLLIITQNDIEFLKVDDELDEKKDWVMKEFIRTKEKKIELSSILSFIQFEFSNRIILKTNNGCYGFLFIKAHNATNFIESLIINNSKINAIRPVTLIRNSDETEEEAEEENSLYILCVIKIQKFFDFITNLFKGIEVVPDAKIGYIKGNKFIIYKEILEEWDKINVNELFEKAINNTNNSNRPIFITDFSKCYKYVCEYDLELFKEILFPIKPNDIIIKFTDTNELSLTLMDDTSYYKFKKILNSFARKKNLISTNNLYDKIN